MEETPRRGILGRHQPCDSETIDILSDSIECHRLSRSASSLLYSKMCWTQDLRSLLRKKHTCHLDLHHRSHYVRNGQELGSKVVQQPEAETVRQPEGEVVRQTKFFQSTQLTPNPIRDRLGRLDEMQDERNTSRSQEISVNSFNEELSSSDRTGRLVETEEIHPRSSEDSKSLNVEQTHDSTGRRVTDTVAVQDDPQVYHEAEMLNNDNEILRERIGADMHFKIPGLPHSTVKQLQSASVRQLIQKIENHPNRHALQ